MHERFPSISYEIVGKSFVRSVISDAHVAGNDGLEFIPPPSGAGTPCRRAFVQDKDAAGLPGGVLFYHYSCSSSRMVLMIRGSSCFFRLTTPGRTATPSFTSTWKARDTRDSAPLPAISSSVLEPRTSVNM